MAGFDLGETLGRAWDTLDAQLGRRSDQSLARIRNAPDLYRGATERADLRRDDQRSLKDLVLSDQRARQESANAAKDAERDDRRRRAALDNERRSNVRADNRKLIDTRAGVYRDAFESQRGDTILSRILWPVALAVGIGGGVYLIAGAKK